MANKSSVLFQIEMTDRQSVDRLTTTMLEALLPRLKPEQQGE